MNEEQKNINLAYDRVLAELLVARDRMLSDCSLYPEDYAGLDVDNAYVWFIEGLAS